MMFCFTFGSSSAVREYCLERDGGGVVCHNNWNGVGAMLAPGGRGEEC